MSKTNYSFSEKEIFTLLFRKKTCPYCGNSKLSRRTVKEFKGKEKNIIDGMTFYPPIDVYQRNFVYQCDKCKKQFSLQSIIDVKNSKNKRKSKVSMFFIVQSIIMMLILFSIAISAKEIAVIIFIPIIIIYYYLTGFFTK